MTRASIRICLSMLSLVLALDTGAEGQIVFYVDDDAAPGGDGLAWSTAFGDLQDALDVAFPGDQIWVASGIYTPDRDTGDRSASFWPIGGVAMYGGFAGFENDTAQRDPSRNLTVLSGEINEAGEPWDNSYHVLRSVGADAQTYIDGFVIAGGNSNGDNNASGSGLLLVNGRPQIVRCVFQDNIGSNSGSGPARGAAVFVDTGSAPIFRDCIFRRNSGQRSATYGGAVGVDTADAFFISCRFENNTTNNGGAIGGMMANIVAVNCEFVENNAIAYGGAIWVASSSLTMMNCVVNGNSTSNEHGGGVYSTSSGARIVNTTVVSNHAAGLGGGFYHASSLSLTVENSVLWLNSDATGSNELSQIETDGSPVTVRYSSVQDWSGFYSGDGNTGADPLLADPNGADGISGTVDDQLWLLSGSPCIDAGDNFALIQDVLDLDEDGNMVESTPLDTAMWTRRVDDPEAPNTGGGQGPLVDMGAYERSFILSSHRHAFVPEDGQVVVQVSLAAAPLSQADLQAELLGPDSDIEILSGSLLQFDASNYSTPQPITLAAGPDSDFLDGISRLRLSGVGLGQLVVLLEEDDDDAHALYVDDDGPVASDGLSWDTAERDLRSALEMAVFLPSVEQIRIGEGRYTPDVSASDQLATFQVLEGVALLGGYAGTGAADPNERDPVAYPTVLSGDLAGNDGPNFAGREENSFHVVSANGLVADVLLDGLTISGGNAAGTSAPHRDGGGILNLESTLTISNCRLTDNSSVGRGAALYVDLSAIALHNSKIDGNQSGDEGGGVFMSRASAALSDLAVENNSAGAHGGGIFVFEHHGALNIDDCDFTNNYSEYNGGGLSVDRVFTDPRVFVRNCRFEDNTAGLIPDFGYMTGGGASIRYADAYFVNCEFVNNSAASRGGGLALDHTSISEITNCRFIGNRAMHLWGGGLTVESLAQVRILNSLFAANSAEAGGGGARFATGNPDPGWIISNSVFFANESRNGVGGGVEGSAPADLVANSIFWANRDVLGEGETSQIWATIDELPTVSYSDIQGFSGRFPGSGSFGADPLFLDMWGPDGHFGTGDEDLHTVAGSPCIDQGDNTLIGPDFFDLDNDGDVDEQIPFDLDGAGRIFNQTVDMGPYEFEGHNCRADFNGDNAVDTLDFLAFFNAFSTGDRRADYNNDGSVSSLDFIAFLNEWTSGC